MRLKVRGLVRDQAVRARVGGVEAVVRELRHQLEYLFGLLAFYASLDRAMAEARAALPGNAPQFIAFPGGSYSTRHHYAVFFQGDTPLTQRLLTPALIDAASGRLTDVAPMPLSMKTLQLSQPLHFGDYGGLPLKLLWAALTGWVARRLSPRAEL